MASIGISKTIRATRAEEQKLEAAVLKNKVGHYIENMEVNLKMQILYF